MTLGTKVSLKDAATGEQLSLHHPRRVGQRSRPRESFPTRPPVARALLNHTVGDEIELSTEEGRSRRVVIEKIEPHQIDLSVPA